jgi:hypothetical protein
VRTSVETVTQASGTLPTTGRFRVSKTAIAATDTILMLMVSQVLIHTGSTLLRTEECKKHLRTADTWKPRQCFRRLRRPVRIVLAGVEKHIIFKRKTRSKRFTICNGNRLQIAEPFQILGSSVTMDTAEDKAAPQTPEEHQDDDEVREFGRFYGIKTAVVTFFCGQDYMEEDDHDVSDGVDVSLELEL